jgi:hypothetical protein
MGRCLCKEAACGRCEREGSLVLPGWGDVSCPGERVWTAVKVVRRGGSGEQ